MQVDEFTTHIENSLNTDQNLDFPIRVQRSRKKGFKMPKNTVYVGRGSRWGNPFRVMQYHDKKWAIKTDGSKRCGEILVTYCHAVYDTKREATIDAIKCYSFWLLPDADKDCSLSKFYELISIKENQLHTLKGKNLACWCSLNEKCHADLLLALVNM